MNAKHTRLAAMALWIFMFLTAVMISGWPARVTAEIVGVTGPNFNLQAATGHVSTSDGDSFLMWLFSNGAAAPQYPGPTLIVTQGQTVTVTLTNLLPAEAGRVSIVFPGQKVTATGGVAGLLTREAANGGGTVTYSFVAGKPGTYLYRSGTRPDLQVEMGLAGALIVRPQMGSGYAYNHTQTVFDREYLLVITEMDPLIHRQVEFGQISQVDTAAYYPTNWFANGRNFPDNIADNFVPWLPNQPYKFQPRMHPGEKVLVRTVGAGVDQHPFHYHGNDAEVIAVDGNLLSSAPGAGPDLAWKANTVRTVPGQTADIFWTWTGEKLGWDIYGHLPTDAVAPLEYAPDHGKPFPVILPTRDNMTLGAFYPGTPFLGDVGDLAPGDPGLNANGGYFYMWHSHTEKELTSNDIWPGGLVTFMMVEHPSVPIP